MTHTKLRQQFSLKNRTVEAEIAKTIPLPLKILSTKETELEITEVSVWNNKFEQTEELRCPKPARTLQQPLSDDLTCGTRTSITV